MNAQPDDDGIEQEDQPSLAGEANPFHVVEPPRSSTDGIDLTPQPFRLDVMTARQLCELPDPDTSDELLGPLVVRGQRVIIGGHTGEGKTTMSLAMLRAIVYGGDFLDWKGYGTGSRALVLDVEQGLRSIKRRLREAGLDESDQVDYARAPDGLRLDASEEHRQALEDQIAQGGYAAVLADPFYKLHRGDSNEERAAVDLMCLFDAWRAAYNFALLLPTHCRKPPPGTRGMTIHDVFGSSGYTRGAEVVLGLERVRNGYSKLYFLKDRDGDLPIGSKWGLLFDREQGFRRDPDDGKPKTRELLAELRASDPELTQKRAAGLLNVSERTIRNHWRESDPGPSDPSLFGEE